MRGTSPCSASIPARPPAIWNQSSRPSGALGHEHATKVEAMGSESRNLRRHRPTSGRSWADSHADIGAGEGVADRTHLHGSAQRSIELFLRHSVGNGEFQPHAGDAIATGLVRNQVQLGAGLDLSTDALLLL